MHAHTAAFTALLAEACPALHAHFCDIGLTADMYLLDWVVTLFARSLPLDVAARLWDVFMMQPHERFLFTTALCLLRSREKELLAASLEEAVTLLRKFPMVRALCFRLNCVFDSASCFTLSSPSIAGHKRRHTAVFHSVL